jgi:5-bromo-4-chloroindolyl phosphate hydrolysis protein
MIFITLIVNIINIAIIIKLIMNISSIITIFNIILNIINIISCNNFSSLTWIEAFNVTEYSIHDYEAFRSGLEDTHSILTKVIAVKTCESIP